MIIRSKKKKKTVSRIVTVSVFAAVSVAAYLLGRLMPRDMADYYSSEVFPFLSSLPQRLSSLVRFSFTEISVVVLGSIAAPLLILWLVFLIKKAMTRGIGNYLYKSLHIKLFGIP